MVNLSTMQYTTLTGRPKKIALSSGTGEGLDYQQEVAEQEQTYRENLAAIEAKEKETIKKVEEGHALSLKELGTISPVVAAPQATSVAPAAKPAAVRAEAGGEPSIDKGGPTLASMAAKGSKAADVLGRVTSFLAEVVYSVATTGPVGIITKATPIDKTAKHAFDWDTQVEMAKDTTGMPITTTGDLPGPAGTQGALGRDAGVGTSGPMGLAAVEAEAGGGTGGASVGALGLDAGIGTSGPMGLAGAEAGAGGGWGCIIISACTDPYSYEVDVTRAFRDRFLSPEQLVGYYRLARYAVPWIERFRAVKRATKALLVDYLIDYGEAALALKPKVKYSLSRPISRGFLKLIEWLGGKQGGR